MKSSLARQTDINGSLPDRIIRLINRPLRELSFPVAGTEPGLVQYKDEERHSSCGHWRSHAIRYAIDSHCGADLPSRLLGLSATRPNPNDLREAFTASFHMSTGSLTINVNLLLSRVAGCGQAAPAGLSTSTHGHRCFGTCSCCR